MHSNTSSSLTQTALRPNTMMRSALRSSLRSLLFGAAAVSAATVAGAQTTLDLAARTTSGDVVYALPGSTIDYEIVGALGGDASEGLAMFAFDLSFSGGDLAQAAAPAAGPILEFVAPRGFNNPEGFGGTVRGGNLLQVGGAMNTIANQFAPVPSGIVVTDFALGAEAVLANGSLTAPTTLGTYTLEISNGFANALDALQPAGFWKVKGAEVTSQTALTVVVVDCFAQTYCTGKVNSQGCVATIDPVGLASLSGAGSLTLTLTDVINRQFGLFVYARSEAQMPLYGGTLCVGSPFTRVLEPTRSGGAGPAGTTCGGQFVRDIDAAFLNANGMLMGETIFCQWIYRDRFQPDMTTVGMSNAVRFTVCP